MTATITEPPVVNGAAVPVAKFEDWVPSVVSPLPARDSDTKREAGVAESVAVPVAAGVADPVAVPVAAPDRRLSWLRAPDGDTVITWAMTFTAAAVILFAAIVSYSHIYALARAHGEDSIQAHLLPLSIDGVIAEASLVMLYAARNKVDAPRLARIMLWSGIVATLAANALVALPPAWINPVANAIIGAILSAWPAAAFIGSVELIMLLVRAVRSVADDSDSEDDSDPEPPKRPRRRRPRSDKVADTIKRHPDWDNEKIAKHCGVTKRTVERRRAKLAKAP